MSGSKVSVVTGGNKGIGFAIVRGLCKQVGGTVILTARSEERGKAAVEELKKEGLNPVFEQLNICSPDSIERFAGVVKSTYGGIDILCNNAGIAYKRASTAPYLEKATVTMTTNFIGTKNVTDALLPLVKHNGRICQVSSMCGILNWIFKDLQNPIRTRLLSPSLTEDDIMAIYSEYMTAVGKDDYSVFKEDSAYSFSKCLLTAHTRVMGRKISGDERKILINCCCPGYVDTDMSSHKGPLTIDEGAVTPLMVCQLPDNSTNGEFYRKSMHFDWENDKYY